ncbi:hypothetical protein ABB37_05341 [Leptomonas pyrrhocoris]|uniref:Uncharacterized protein n=1 Tax=Leptomonas pyrrhocoris TaxID=157538 RepID=A0A0M9G083_LEPPY|nr:hypothetical protein ABB37_05341 [Leptomonas pyrrhocoris]KPA79517.1 hypothetical protein ABB37_05341 [Leptomonas pyrrhocoris]|eukprot:XP_015657956.1 hypothetical protein ABB37_05341 [Leptomonas pyrrhocoris]
MLGGPYPPRVVPANTTGDGAVGYHSVDRVDHPSVRRVAAPTTTATTATGLQPTPFAPCGIPWNRLYSSSTTLRPQENHEDRRSYNSRAEASPLRNSPRSTPPAPSPAGAAAAAAAAVSSSLLYRPPYFSATYPSPPPPPPAPTGAPATVVAYDAAVSHRYHADETIPASQRHTAATTQAPTSILSTSTALSSRYQQMAAEHRYGAALPAAGQAKAAHARQERRDDVTHHQNGSRDEVGALPPRSTQNRRQSPFSSKRNDDDSDDDRADRKGVEGPRTSRSMSSRVSQKGSTTVAVAPKEETRRSRSNSSNSRHSRGPQRRGGPVRAASSPPQRPTRTAAVPRQTRSASHASPRTAQWAVKLIDEFVAQVAVQQASAATGPAIVSTPLPSTSLGRRCTDARGATVAGPHQKDPTSVTVADLTTSFLAARYGALQWRPMLQEFAVCLHRFHLLSPTCAVFREYFIHVDADALRDFQLFCRLFAAADIPHCSTVETRRVALGDGQRRKDTHTIVARRYVEVREVVDRLQRMLQRVVLLDTAPCVVVADGNFGDASRRRSHSASTARRCRQGGDVSYRFGRGPPARTTTVPRRRRLTADEVYAVKRVVVTWLEDSVEAERDAAERSAEEEDEDAPTTLRHIAFDRPGRVDAYALLQATLEAVKLLCNSAPPPHRTCADVSNRNELDADDDDDEEEAEAEDDTEGDLRRGKAERAPVLVEHNGREGRRQRQDGARTTSPQAHQQPPWQATASKPMSPLVRHVLASPPHGYAYPVEEPHKSSPVSAVRGRLTPSSARCSPVRPSHASRRHTSEVDYFEGNLPYEEEEGGVEEEAGDEMADGRRCRSGSGHDERRRDHTPSYRQPRAASAATAAAIAVHRAPDGRLWSPPRDGVLVHRGGRGEGQRQPLSHRSSRSPSRRRSSAQPGDAVTSPRLSSRERTQQQQHQGRERRGSDGREESEEDREEEHDYGRDDGLSLPRRSVHAYVANLHAEKRWQETQQQVAAAERRDAFWRQNPRIQARLQQQQLQQQQLPKTSYRNSSSDPALTATAAGPALSPYADTSAVDATINDIDNELRRRERSHGRLRATKNEARREPPQPLFAALASPPRPVQDAVYLRNLQEAAAFASQQVRPVPPPELAQPADKAMMRATSEDDGAYPPRIYPIQESRAAGPPSGHNSRIRVEQVTPPASVAARLATAAPSPPPPSADVRLTKDAALSKEAVFLTDEEQAMLDQLEVALRRLDGQHRLDHAAAATAATTTAAGVDRTGY